jgi:hypothetical protein
MSADLEGLLEIEVRRQAGRDLATEATEAHDALELSVLGHRHPPADWRRDTIATSHWHGWATAPLRGVWIDLGTILMAVNGPPEILSDCCCAVTATARAGDAASIVYPVIREIVHVAATTWPSATAQEPATAAGW